MINLSFESELATTIFELEPLRDRATQGTTPPWLFYELKEVMHLLESIASARIEGNMTTLLSAAKDVVKDGGKSKTEPFREIYNVKDGIEFIENNIVPGENIELSHIREIHKITTHNLTPGEGEGSLTPGVFRRENVRINNSNCTTYDFTKIQEGMEKLVSFINEPNASKYDIIKVALVHHDFTVIHPFDNGNGRTARLLTYAMLLNKGFLNRDGFALLNPSAMFCVNRDEYYNNLGQADLGTDEGKEKWCLYVANGIKNELEKVHKMLNKDYAVDKIINPALKMAKKDNDINDLDLNILKVAMESDIFQAKDVNHLFGMSQSEQKRRSRYLSDMVEKGILMRHPKYSKRYVMRFFNKTLLPHILKSMDESDLISVGIDEEYQRRDTQTL